MISVLRLEENLEHGHAPQRVNGIVLVTSVLAVVTSQGQIFLSHLYHASEAMQVAKYRWQQQQVLVL